MATKVRKAAHKTIGGKPHIHSRANKTEVENIKALIISASDVSRNMGCGKGAKAATLGGDNTALLHNASRLYEIS